jgi:hypothetical protein
MYDILHFYVFSLCNNSVMTHNENLQFFNYKMSSINDGNILFFALNSKDTKKFLVFFLTMHRYQLIRYPLKISD